MGPTVVVLAVVLAVLNVQVAFSIAGMVIYNVLILVVNVVALVVQEVDYLAIGSPNRSTQINSPNSGHPYKWSIPMDLDMA